MMKMLGSRKGGEEIVTVFLIIIIAMLLVGFFMLQSQAKKQKVNLVFAGMQENRMLLNYLRTPITEDIEGYEGYSSGNIAELIAFAAQSGNPAAKELVRKNTEEILFLRYGQGVCWRLAAGSLSLEHASGCSSLKSSVIMRMDIPPLNEKSLQAINVLLNVG